VRNQGIGAWPARRARKTPDRVAVVHAEREWTYRELYERVLRLAHALRGIGVERGDRVGYLGPNHPAFLETLFAAGTLGAVFVPLNTRLARPELAYQLADSGTGVLIHAPEHAGIEAPQAIGLDTRYEELLASGGTEPIDEPVSLDDIGLIMYTSGTTGRAKGAVLRHANLTWNALNVLVDADIASDEVTLISAPLFHTAGLNMNCLPTLLKGGRVVLTSAFDPGRTLELVRRYRVTLMFGVPAMFNAIADQPDFATADLSSVRTLMCGGAPVPEATIRRYLDRGLAFVQGYGMTEAAAGTLLLDRAQALTKAGSAGVPHFFTDVRVTRPDGTDTAPDERGEVVVRGPNVMAGYWGLPDADAFGADGWFHTGDVAVTDEDGYVYIVDRLKDVIISGGENIYPAEVERELVAHPAVADVAVIGVPDDKWGEVGRAVVVLRPGTEVAGEALAEFLLGRIAKYKIPKQYRFVDGLPRTATGKILRKVLRETQG
jgi:acyl-CoA synthetase (AMP-forming)/AMP-acid ligase II